MALTPVISPDAKEIIENHINRNVDKILTHSAERLANPIYQSMDKIKREDDN